jgi:hypothetical protein
LISAVAATATVVWALWAPWSPEGVNEVIRSQPEIIPVTIGGWLFQFTLVLFLLRWVDGV